MNLVINVTQECIDQEKAGDCGKCPVALAMMHAGLLEITVHPSYVTFSRLGKFYNVDLPDRIMKFVYQFDCGREVQPTQFEIRRAA